MLFNFDPYISNHTYNICDICDKIELKMMKMMID